MANFNADGKMVFVIFIGLIITAVFIGSIADSVFLQTNTIAIVNFSATVPATANTTFSPQLPGRQNITVITVLNATGSDFTNNFTVNTTNAQGTLGIFLFPTDAAVTAGVNGSAVNLTFTYQDNGFLQDSGARSISALIVIISALAMVVFVIVVLWQTSLKELLTNRRFNG